MKVGTPGFVGERLREAREARALSATALADLVGVKRTAISQYEAGLTTPRPDVMAQIAGKLRLGIAFFQRAVVDEDVSTVFYRSLSSATKTERTRAERRYGWLRDIARYLKSYVEVPPTNLPSELTPSDPTSLSGDEIEELAAKVRRFWRLGDGPISNLCWLLENNGTVVARSSLATEAIDAYSSWAGGRHDAYIILGADKGAAARSRLDAAHELAHLILHRDVERRQFNHPAVHRQLEKQAQRFAGAFLLPARPFADEVDFPSLDSFLRLKTRWRVSVGVMIARASETGMISSDHCQRLWITYNRRRWRGWEPLDDELPVEEPRLLSRSFEVILNAGVQSRSDVLAALPYGADDVEDLAGLPRGFLSDEPPVKLLDLSKRRRQVRPGRPPGPGGIVSHPAARRPTSQPDDEDVDDLPF